MTKKNIIDEQELKEEIAEFKKFAIKKNILELAIGVILATAFTKVVNGVSECFLMPIINASLGYTDGPWRKWIIQLWTIRFEIGKFLGLSIDFLITAIVLYIIYVKILGAFVSEAPKPMPIPIVKKKKKKK